MNIVVSGVLNYREFHFPANFFRSGNRIISMVGAGPHHDYNAGDLTASSREFAKDVLALGGIEYLDFVGDGYITVWSFLDAELSDFPAAKIDQIQRLIHQYYGPQADRIIYLPFGAKLVLPRQ